MEGKGGEWNQWEGKNVGTVTFRRLFRKRVGFWVKRPSNPPRIGPPLFGFNIISLRPMRHEQADGGRRSPQIVVLILLIFPPLLLLFRHSPFPSLGHMFLSFPATPPFFFFFSLRHKMYFEIQGRVGYFQPPVYRYFTSRRVDRSLFPSVGP